MTIAAVPALTGLGVAATPTTQAATNAAGAGPNFASALEAASQTGLQADALAAQVATGDLPNIQQFTSAAVKAELTVDLVVAIRNRAVEAYQEVMRMSV